jgi:hypothetical protein
VTHDKIRYEFEGCKWDEETTVKGEMDGCGADCTRGAWTLPELACDVARSHALQRVGVLARLNVHIKMMIANLGQTHDMDCSFRC